MFKCCQQSYYINSHDFHWGCVQPSFGRRGTVKWSPVGVMGVRKQSMYYRCLQLAWWRLEYNPLWGEGVLAGPLHSALMWAPFNFLSIFLWLFEQRFPHFSMEGYWKDFHLHWIAPMYLQEIMWRHESRLNYAQLYILIWHLQLLTNQMASNFAGKFHCWEINVTQWSQQYL